jgi:acyl carrier protein
MTDLRAAISETIQEILSDKGRSRDVIGDEERLIETLGLDSLDLAVLVVKLEKQLGCDPFRDGRGAVATFGELVAVYDRDVGDAA